MKSSEERLQFQNDFLSLGQGRIIPQQDDKFWSRFWRLPTKSQDILELISLEDVRNVRHQNVVNYITFIKRLSLKVIEVANSEFLTNSDIVVVLNCIRFLVKLLPPMLELHDYDDTIGFELFWNLRFDTTEYLKSKEVAETPGAEDKAKKSISCDEVKDTLAFTLMMALVDLLYTKGFTINTKEKGGISLSVWEPGLGFSGKPRSPNLVIDSNRTEVLKLIVTLCSDGFYCTPSTIVSKGSRFLTVLVSMTPKVKLLTLISSLLNLTCRSSKSNEESALHYDSINYTETRHLCVTYAFSLLTMMMVYPIPHDTGITGCKLHNLTRRYLSKVHKESELALIATSLIDILRFPLAARDSENGSFNFSKNTQPSIWATNGVIFMWELIQCNKNFEDIVTKKHIPSLMVILLYYVFEFKTNDGQKNLVRVCAYLLLYLSSQLEMLGSLFHPISLSLYESLPPSYKLSISPLTTRDFMVSQLCSILLNSYPVQPPTYSFRPLPKLLLNSLVETLYNLIIPVSEHELKVHNNPSKKLNNPNSRGGLSYQASSLVTQLIARFSSKSFLLEKPYHLNVVALLIRAVCIAVVKYPHPSRMLLFSILKNERVYDNLWNTIFNIQEYSVRGDSISKIDEVAVSEVNETDIPATVTSNGDENVPSTPIPILPRNTNDDSLTVSESESVESSLRPRPPPGMSDKARDKQRKDSPIGQVWAGKDVLALILTVIIPHLKSVLSTLWTGTRGASVDTFELVQKIECSDFSEMIEDNRHQLKYELLPEAPLEQLKFEWSLLSLGWYLSLLYSEIYNASSQVKTCIGNNNGLMKNFSNSLATVSKITSGWTSFLKQEEPGKQVDDFTLQWIENGMTDVNTWQGTTITLFDVSSTSKDGFFASFNKYNGTTSQAVPNTPGGLNDMMKRFSDFNLNGATGSPVSSVPSTPGEEQESYFTRRSGRNSVTSLHSLNKLNRIRSNTPRNSLS
ncbi:hypothetical protein CANMA_004486 [Candida margitis]|uniref:uncharacterized protein n=1 Tax=Candida margitis TaxID=1775924 RepID=UPI0022280963|nr:uncharacterized protein CANMA_004486 [Candida margitis]KAI5956649.1 hypothetical protein CANMA_004486 [Candida margitis]